jgi:uncharacterized membrane protein
MANETPPTIPEASTFSAVLRPHRSLGPTGFLVLMSIISLICFSAGLVFYFMGAWPVFGFFGLDVLLIYIAFRLNYRSGRMYETVDLSPSELTVTRVHASGREERYVFNPYWTRVYLAHGRDGRTDLRLHLHGKELSFGRFLTDEERQDFAHALTGALIASRGGARI